MTTPASGRAERGATAARPEPSRPRRSRRSLILETGTRTVFHTILVFSAFLLFSGHNAPGGGFIGGLVAVAAFVLHYLTHGPDSLRRLVPVAPETLLGGGVALAAATGMGGLLLGRAFLEAGVYETDLPVLGHLKVPSVLAFDIGVYLVVLGLGLLILLTLGAEIAE